MPNWIEGNMKVRGKAKDVYNFFCEVFTLYGGKWLKKENGDPYYLQQIDPSGVNIEYYDDCAAEITIREGCYIKETRRAFCNGEANIYFEDITTEKEVTKCIDVKQAWCWYEDGYKELSDEYDVDIKLIGWECGMEYKGELEVLRGKEPTYKETQYDDWVWETECPTLGG